MPDLCRVSGPAGGAKQAAALIISALAVTTLAAPPQLLLSEQDGAVATTRALAVEVAALVLDNQDLKNDKPTTLSNTGKNGSWESPEAHQLSRLITDALADAFVVRPAMLLSYGQTFEGACAKKFQESRIEQAVVDQFTDELLDKPEDMMSQNMPARTPSRPHQMRPRLPMRRVLAAPGVQQSHAPSVQHPRLGPGRAGPETSPSPPGHRPLPFREREGGPQTPCRAWPVHRHGPRQDRIRSEAERRRAGGGALSQARAARG